MGATPFWHAEGSARIKLAGQRRWEVPRYVLLVERRAAAFEWRSRVSAAEIAPWPSRPRCKRRSCAVGGVRRPRPRPRTRGVCPAGRGRAS